jgi:hypothetical protein
MVQVAQYSLAGGFYKYDKDTSQTSLEELSAVSFSRKMALAHQ